MFSSLCYFISFFSMYTFIHKVVNNIGFSIHSEMPVVFWVCFYFIGLFFFFFYLFLFIRENTATLVKLKAYVTTKELKMSRGP